MSRTSTPAELSTEAGVACTAGITPTVWQRVRAHWRLKLLMLVGLTISFCGPYLFLAHNAFFPVNELPLTVLDRLAGFDTRWVWVYQSVYLLTGTLPWLATQREQLRRYLIGFVLLTSVCIVIYIFWPIRVPRPVVEDAGGMYWLLLCYDGPYNALPSLHAGFLYYTLAFARRVYGPPPVGVAVGLIGWAVLILWSTLATKEHYAVDLAAGIALAVVCDMAAWSRMFRRTADASHIG